MTSRVAAIALCAALAAAVAEAQGNRGVPPGLLRKPETSGGPASPGTPAPAAVRTFGVWLDDATLAAPGAVWVTVAATRWKSPVGTGVDVPVVGLAVGLTRRAQLSLSTSHSRFSPSEGTGETTRGFGNLYAGLKFVAVDRTNGAFGLSIGPTIEVLNEATADAAGTGRVHAILPVSIEIGKGPARVYASAGYFTRGATFASGAVEVHLAPRFIATASLMQSWATTLVTDTDEALGLVRRRTDVGGSITLFVTPSAALFASVGRTVSEMDFDSTRVVFSAGLSFGLAPALEMPPRPPR